MNWLPPFDPCITEEDITLGYMSIKSDEEVLTKNISNITNTSRDDIKVSSYPLAIWICAYWWRLIYEPIPSDENIQKTYSWENAHNLISADSGYIWPSIKFIPDGQTITISSQQQIYNRKYPLFYKGLKDPISINTEVFTSSMKNFISNTIQRLDEHKKNNTDLHIIFDQLQTELNDEDFTLYRKMEAILGYDPDEAPENVIKKIESALKIFNEKSLIEIASACSVNETHTQYADIESAISMARNGIKGKWSSPISEKINIDASMPPWEAGRLLAKEVRKCIGNIDNKIETKTLCDFLGVTTKSINNKEPLHDRFNISYFKSDNLYINLKKENTFYYSIGRRFQLARLIGAIISSISDKIFISSDCKTYNQKLQRAFAAEFLAPINEVKFFIEKELSTKSIRKAAKHFDVSPQTIAHSLVNNGVISKQKLDDFEL